MNVVLTVLFVFNWLVFLLGAYFFVAPFFYTGHEDISPAIELWPAALVVWLFDAGLWGGYWLLNHFFGG